MDHVRDRTAIMGRTRITVGGFSDLLPHQTIFTGTDIVAEQSAISTETPDALQLFYENIGLRFSNAELSLELNSLAERLERLEERVQAEGSPVVLLRELSRDDAKAEIKELFTARGTLDYEVIVTTLRLDLELVVDICEELTEEGAIGPDDD
ncbi:MAG: hypothetical protein IH959_00070 [Chloroflexi bacterium]|nr:hypothetical protein [Chloroflexota bacterium]